jgi:predicted RNA-binding Zn ribbon-like protein
MNTEYSTTGFKFIGGSLCLDFVNTVEGRSHPRKRQTSSTGPYVIHRDKLPGYADLVLWCQQEETDLLSAGDVRELLQLARSHSRAAQAVFQRALGLREALYRIFKSVVSDRKPDSADIQKLNKEKLRAKGHEKLVFSSATFENRWEEMGSNLDAPLWPLIRSAAELLTSDLSRLRQCGGEECGWFFLDTSRNHSRQWCDMKDCGNLAKVRRFRERQQLTRWR